MAFVTVEKARLGGAGIQPPQVTMGAYLGDGKTHKTKSVSFRISKTLVEQLGWEVVDRVVYLTLNEGTDADKGYIQVVPSTSDTFNSRRTTIGIGPNQGLSISVTAVAFKHYVLNECPVASRPAQHMVDDNVLIIECPDWLRYNPQSVPTPVTDIQTRRGPGRPRRQQG